MASQGLDTWPEASAMGMGHERLAGLHRFVARVVKALLVAIFLICAKSQPALAELITLTIDPSSLLTPAGGTAHVTGTITNLTGVALNATDLFLDFSGFNPDVVTPNQLLGTSDFVLPNGATSPALNLFDLALGPTALAGNNYRIEVLLQDINNHSSNIVAVDVTAAADILPPQTTIVAIPAPNLNGWNNTTVTVTLSSVDEPSGSGVKQVSYMLSGAQVGAGTVAGSTASVTITAEGITTIRYFATDNAENKEAPKTLTVRVDETPPTVSFGLPAPPPNAAGWNNTTVSIPFTQDDSLAGVASTNITSPLVLTTEGTAVTGTVTVSDKAGNRAMFSSPAVKIDKTPPTVACVTFSWPTRRSFRFSRQKGRVANSFARPTTMTGINPGSSDSALRLERP